MLRQVIDDAKSNTNTHICSAAADLYDITSQVEAIVTESGVQTGLVNVYVQGATAGGMILFI